jgi:peptide/nickel transport system ATP-binding protein
MAMLLVTHDLRVVAALADRVLVMYGGTIVERGPVEAVFDCPAHPYTQALFDSYDGLSGRFDGGVHSPPADGCRFREECQYATDACRDSDQPDFVPVRDDQCHAVSCVYYDETTTEDPLNILRNARDARPHTGGQTDD